MKDVFVKFIITKNQHFKSYLKRISLFQYTTEICKSSQQKCIRGYPQKFLQTLSRPETNVPLVNSVYNGTESIAFLDSKVWDLVSEEVKQKESLTAFKDPLKKWSLTNCPLDYIKMFLPNKWTL